MSELVVETAVLSLSNAENGAPPPAEVVEEDPVHAVAVRPKACFREEESVSRASSGEDISAQMAQTREILEEIEKQRSGFFREATRCCLQSSSSDEGQSEKEISAREEEVETEKPAEPRYRLLTATDSGYESDRRKSLSSASSSVDSVPAIESPRSPEEKGEEQERGVEIRGCHPHMPHLLPLLRPLMPVAHPMPVQQQVAIQHHLPLRQQVAIRNHPFLMQQRAAIQHQPIMAYNPHILTPVPRPAVLPRQAEAAVPRAHSESWEHFVHILNLQPINPIQSRFVGPRPSSLPPVVLPLPYCYKSSSVGPKETRKYAVPKYAIGFVIGNNGTRIQASRDVSGATILLLGDKDSQYTIIGVIGSPDQIQDAIFLMKQNILRHSGMFIGDIDGMFQPIND